MFKKMPSLKMPYNKQGLIYFLCHNYEHMPFEIQKRIINSCIKAGGEYYNSLFELMTTDKPIQLIAMDGYVSERHLRRLRRKFYEHFFEKTGEE